jgi:hypothetical protein
MVITVGVYIYFCRVKVSVMNNYLCNQCLSPLKLRVGIPQMARCTLYNIQHYVIEFVSDLQQVCRFLQVLQFPLQIKLTATYLTEILLKVALNTITLTVYHSFGSSVAYCK